MSKGVLLASGPRGLSGTLYFCAHISTGGTDRQMTGGSVSGGPNRSTCAGQCGGVRVVL
jgi:hypothetical protein